MFVGVRAAGYAWQDCLPRRDMRVFRPVSRRTFLAAAGGTAVGALLAGSTPQDIPSSLALLPDGSPPARSGYAPDGVAGRTAAFPLSAVRLLDSPFRANQARNTD
jgi:hypothetical protein